mgnify:CR=1 FL=1|tara:strand:+ start:438 stop:1412 length:975 start_codon:yes stop_codon:yes gene_type:complete
MIKNRFIPTINISPLTKKNLNSKKVNNIIKQIELACINIGFFQIVGHGISLKKIKNLCNVGNNFFKSTYKNKTKLAPKKWNKNNKNVYRGYFPNDINGKEGLDIGDLRVTKNFSNKIKNQYIEYIDLKKSFNKKDIVILSDYFDRVYNLSEILFKCIIKIYKKDPSLSRVVFSRLKTLSTLRFNYYPNQSKPIEISKQDGVALGCETHVDSGIFTVLYQDKRGGLQVQNRKNKKWYNVPFNKNALVVNTGRALEFLSKSKFKATNHRVLWNRKERMSVPFFFEPSFDFKMNKDLLTNKNIKQNNAEIYEKFLNNSLKKFIEYQR